MINYSQKYTSRYSYPSIMTVTEIDDYLKNLGQRLSWSQKYLQKNGDIDNIPNILLKIYILSPYIILTLKKFI